MADVVRLSSTVPSDPCTIAERRVEVISSILEIVSCLPRATGYGDVLRTLMDDFDLSEEVIGPEALDAVFLLVRSDLVLCNTYDSASTTLTINSTTKLAPSAQVSEFVWGRLHLTKSDIPT